jgi:vacuolar-type H+-ATPase subunit I/STV1
MLEPFEIVRVEASHWWRTNVVAGAILDRLMWLFIVVAVYLVVAKGYVLISFLVFLGMIPYGLFLRHLAQRSLLRFIEEHPETIDEFEESGIIRRRNTTGSQACLPQDL